MDATPRWVRAVRRPPPCGLGRATSGAERGEWRPQYPVRPGVAVAVADTDNYHERGRWAGGPVGRSGPGPPDPAA